MTLLVCVDQIAFVSGSWNQLWPSLRKGRIHDSFLHCLALHLCFTLHNGEAMGNPVQLVYNDGQSLLPLPTAQQILHILHNLIFGLYWINPRGNASADVFSPFKQFSNPLAFWGDYSNISHILVYLESYIFCNFDLVILCWSLLTSPVVSVNKLLKKKSMSLYACSSMKLWSVCDIQKLYCLVKYVQMSEDFKAMVPYYGLQK